MSGHENITAGMREFERDLRDIFAERYEDLQPKLKELLLELWLRGTKLGERIATPTDNPNNGMHPTENFGPEIRMDEATGLMRTLSGPEGLDDLERRLNLLAPQLLNPNQQGLEDQLDSIVQMNGGLVTNTMQNMGITDAWQFVPVVMNKDTGEVFGVDLKSRQKILVASATLQLVCNDAVGHKWDVPPGVNSPPTKNDAYASHVICRVNGEIKTAPTDYTITTGWNHGEECIESIWFGVMLGSDTETVELTYNSHTTEYF